MGFLEECQLYPGRRKACSMERAINLIVNDMFSEGPFRFLSFCPGALFHLVSSICECHHAVCPRRQHSGYNHDYQVALQDVFSYCEYRASPYQISTCVWSTVLQPCWFHLISYREVRQFFRMEVGQPPMLRIACRPLSFLLTCSVSFSVRLIPNTYEVAYTYSQDYEKSKLPWPNWIAQVTNIRYGIVHGYKPKILLNIAAYF